MGSTRKSDHHRVKPADAGAGQPLNQLFERNRLPRREPGAGGARFPGHRPLRWIAITLEHLWQRNRVGKGIAARGTAIRTARMDDLPLHDFRLTG